MAYVMALALELAYITDTRLLGIEISIKLDIAKFNSPSSQTVD